jgi:hypothetical protein
LVDEKKEISQNLTSLRKKYDETREVCNKKEQEINKMRVYEIALCEYNRQKSIK